MTLLTGELVETVTDLKEQPAKDLYIMGSGVLIGSLMPLGLIDDMLLICPLVLGSGRRLFPEGSPRTPLQLMNTLATTAGVVMATYQPAKS